MLRQRYRLTAPVPIEFTLGERRLILAIVQTGGSGTWRLQAEAAPPETPTETLLLAEQSSEERLRREVYETGYTVPLGMPGAVIGTLLVQRGLGERVGEPMRDAGA